MIHRIDVRPRGGDPLGESVAQQIRDFGIDVERVATARIFLIDSDAQPRQILAAGTELLADPIVESIDPDKAAPDASRIEIHLKPGVMDPVAASTEMALRDMGIDVREVRTGRVYFIDGAMNRDLLEQIARKVLANGVIESVHFEPFLPKEFEVAHERPFELRRVPLTNLTDEDLKKLSRDGHLFLSLVEMQAIQGHYREQRREPTDIELETLAQTWSEHCVHKTLKSAVDVYDDNGKLLRHYDNLIRDTIFGATNVLISGTGFQPEQGAQHGLQIRATKRDFCLSVFKDNAGVIAFDETDAVCFKVETHNHPSAIEPYGGAATGIGGCIRDVMGTGLSARPIANTDVFCVAYPDQKSLPRGVIHPKRILRQVVAGVRDYGNRMGIPTVNGAVYFDDGYIGNPLVFAGCVGIIPRDKIHKEARPGDAIVVMGGRTGRDGIHGATFSSAELTDTHADEFSHAVQIGNAITQKKMLDVILQARDRNLFTAITDCGAGGLSSAVGEMGEKLGAAVQLDRVPLKYAGLRHDEIWISEAQERMVLSVPQEHVKALLALAASEDVEATVIGSFGTDSNDLVLNYRGEEVGRLSMQFLHNGLPMPRRKALIRGAGAQPVRAGADLGGSRASGGSSHGSKASVTVKDQLLSLLAHPNIASKHWIIRQYDHEVQGGSVIKPLTGPLQIGPSDAAVIRPKLDSHKGVVIACGLAPAVEDPYDMAIAAIDEAVRNAVCVGADPDRLAILDNFCWPSCDDEETMGALVRACEACRDAAMAFGIPFISGKDSLNNQFTDTETGRVIRIPRTLLISAIGVVDDVRKCVTMNLKGATDRLILIRPHSHRLEDLARVHRSVAHAINAGLINACHDVSDGGWLLAVAEMCIASGLGATIPLLESHDVGPFAEMLASFVVAVPRDRVDSLIGAIGDSGIAKVIGDASLSSRLVAFRSKTDALDSTVEELTRAWRGTLDW